MSSHRSVSPHQRLVLDMPEEENDMDEPEGTPTSSHKKRKRRRLTSTTETDTELQLEAELIVRPMQCKSSVTIATKSTIYPLLYPSISTTPYIECQKTKQN